MYLPQKTNTAPRFSKYKIQDTKYKIQNPLLMKCQISFFQGDFERIKITEDEEIFCLGVTELLKELKDLEVSSLFHNQNVIIFKRRWFGCLLRCFPQYICHLQALITLLSPCNQLSTLKFLKVNVEDIRSGVINKKNKISIQDVENLAMMLSRSI